MFTIPSLIASLGLSIDRDFMNNSFVRKWPPILLTHAKYLDHIISAKQIFLYGVLRKIRLDIKKPKKNTIELKVFLYQKAKIFYLNIKWTSYWNKCKPRNKIRWIYNICIHATVHFYWLLYSLLNSLHMLANQI